MLLEALTAGAVFSVLEPRLRAAFDRVSAAIGIANGDWPAAIDLARLDVAVDVFMWHALRWTFASDLHDVEEAVELGEDILATVSTADAARAELFAMIAGR